jgi:NADH-quinone oxidoreductase subunit L
MEFSPKVLAFLIVLFPLMGWAAIGLFGKRLNRRDVGFAATATVLASFICGLVLLILVGKLDGPLLLYYGNWIDTPLFLVNFGFQIDHLSLLMILVVSGVSMLIH